MEHISPGMMTGVLHGVFTTRIEERSICSSDDRSNKSSEAKHRDKWGDEIFGGHDDAVRGFVLGKNHYIEDDHSDVSESDSDDSSVFGASGAHSGLVSNKPKSYVKLPHDVYSLLYFTVPGSLGFFFAVGTFFFQLLILTLIMIDIVDAENEGNPLNIPAGVSTVVRISQFLAILVAVSTQDDLITSVNAMHTGYDGRIERREGTGGRYWQWVVSVSGRFLEGSLCLAVTFILIMQSSDVVGLFLDFLAVTFVSTLDDIAFALAQDGYFSKTLNKETNEVAKTRIPKPDHPNHHLFRPFVFAIVSVSMLAGWGVVSASQKNGQYLSCDRIGVQFGDEFRVALGFFSSVYEVDRFDLEGRPMYVERGQGGGSSGNTGLYGHAFFAYCTSETAWTFSYSDSASSIMDLDPCRAWYAKSSETTEWDIMSVAHSDWYAYGRASKMAMPFQHFSVMCVDCDDSPRGACAQVGTCSANGDRCNCYEGRYGLNCEFEEPCRHIAIDTSRKRFLALEEEDEEWSDEFRTLYQEDNVTKAKAYERPVFTNEYENGTHHVIMYTGRRWILLDSKELADLGNQRVSSGQLADYLTNSFHAHWSSYRAAYVSSPADVVTPTDAATPIGLNWFQLDSYTKGPDENSAVSTQLLCTFCDDRTNPCENGGTCDATTGKCVCPYGIFGDLCQVKSFVLCRTVTVQFGDELVSRLPSFGGPYDLAKDRTVAGRSVYVARRKQGAMFAYCRKEEAWTLTPLPPGGQKSYLDADPCKDWIVMSAPTETYDLASLATGWSVRRTGSINDGVPISYFSMVCVDCGRNRKRDPCSGAGTCINKTCSCDEGKLGLSCQMREPCQVLQLDSSAGVFKRPAKYRQLQYDGKDVITYERPVYVSDAVQGSSVFLMLFTGRRWVISKLETHSELTNLTSKAELAQYLSRDFHAGYSNYTNELISEPVQVNTNMDVASPVDLNWFLPKIFDKKRPDLQAPMSVSPMCAFCDNFDYPCNNKGVCNDGLCSCPVGTFGTLCQEDYVCTSVSLDFSSSLPEQVSELSGVYIMKDGGRDTIGGRPIYMFELGTAFIAYCKQDSIWTFTRLKAKQVGGRSPTDNLPDPCIGWTARSSPSYKYDVTETSNWRIRKNVTSSRTETVFQYDTVLRNGTVLQNVIMNGNETSPPNETIVWKETVLVNETVVRNESSIVTMSRALFSFACNDERRRVKEYKPSMKYSMNDENGE